MEISIKVLLCTSNDVKNFYHAANTFARNIGIKAEHNGFVVDGRSILGMFSLDLSEPVTVRFIGNDIIDETEIHNKFSEWEV